MLSQPPPRRAPSSPPRPWQVAAGLSPRAHLGCRRAAQTWGLGNGGGGQQPRSWAPESKGLEVSPKTLQPTTVSSPSPGSLPAWGACQHPSLPSHSALLLRVRLLSPHPHAGGALSSVTTVTSLWGPPDGLAPTALHMHVTVLDCRISPPACPPRGVTPHTSLATSPPACRDQCTSQSLSISFPKRFLNAFLFKREKKRKKKTMPTAQRP